jgi:hypothetical protein
MRFPRVEREGNALTYTGAAPPVVIGASRDMMRVTDDGRSVRSVCDVRYLRARRSRRRGVVVTIAHCTSNGRQLRVQVQTETIGRFRGLRVLARSVVLSMAEC